MKVLVLVHQDLIPPKHVKSSKELENSPWKTEYDVIRTLSESGHKVLPVGLYDELRPLREAVEEFKPRVVFNLLEEFAGQAIFDQHVVSFMEALGIKYTGCNPRGLLLSRDKALAKKILRYHRIPTPNFQVFLRNKKIQIGAGVKFPQFVKPLNEEASTGITKSSVVKNKQELVERIEHFHNMLNLDVIAEDFIPGREIYVSVLGNERLTVFPPLELFFKNFPEGEPKVATNKAKWDLAYRKKMGISTGPAKNLDPATEKRILHVCKRAYRRLGISGYARFDLRLSDSGEIYILEANPNPDIAFKEEFADSAELAGVSYPQLLDKILRLGSSWSSAS